MGLERFAAFAEKALFEVHGIAFPVQQCVEFLHAAVEFVGPGHGADAFPDQSVLRIAEHFRHGVVDVEEQAATIEDGNAQTGFFEDRTEHGLAFAHPLLGAQALGNVCGYSADAVYLASGIGDGKFPEIDGSCFITVKPLGQHGLKGRTCAIQNFLIGSDNLLPVVMTRHRRKNLLTDNRFLSAAIQILEIFVHQDKAALATFTDTALGKLSTRERNRCSLSRSAASASFTSVTSWITATQWIARPSASKSASSNSCT